MLETEWVKDSLMFSILSVKELLKSFTNGSGRFNLWGEFGLIIEFMVLKRILGVFVNYILRMFGSDFLSRCLEGC